MAIESWPEEHLKQKIQAFQWELLGLAPQFPNDKYHELQNLLTEFQSKLKGRDMY